MKNKYQHYETINAFYKSKKTSKNVPYINHINEGIIHLEEMKVSNDTINAFILHPLAQCVNLKGADAKVILTQKEMDKHFNIYDIEPIIAYELLMYRKFANAYLCRPETDDYTFNDAFEVIKDLKNDQSVLKMLVADKLQNYKDFVIYRKNDHKRSKELETYFNYWLLSLIILVDSYEIKEYIKNEMAYIKNINTKQED